MVDESHKSGIITGTRCEEDSVRFSSNDHPEMESLTSQLLEFKTACFNIVLSYLGIQGLDTMLMYLTLTMDFVIVNPNKWSERRDSRVVVRA